MPVAVAAEEAELSVGPPLEVRAGVLLVDIAAAAVPDSDIDRVADADDVSAGVPAPDSVVDA